jgi:hypothetical protein
LKANKSDKKSFDLEEQEQALKMTAIDEFLVELFPSWFPEAHDSSDSFPEAHDPSGSNYDTYDLSDSNDDSIDLEVEAIQDSDLTEIDELATELSLI